jgi:hypothetical protein
MRPHKKLLTLLPRAGTAPIPATGPMLSQLCALIGSAADFLIARFKNSLASGALRCYDAQHGSD